MLCVCVCVCADLNHPVHSSAPCSGSTAASIKPGGAFYIGTLISSIMIPIIIAGTQFFLINLSVRVAKSDNHSVVGTLHTVAISNLPLDFIDQRKFYRHFVRIYGMDKIADATIAIDLEAPFEVLTMRRDKYQKLLDKYQATVERNTSEADPVKETSFRNPMYRPNWLKPWHQVDAIQYLKEQLNATNREIEQLCSTQNGVRGSGYGYVTFLSEDFAKQCIRDFKSKSWRRTEGRTRFGREMKMLQWKVKPAPPSDDILWDNLPFRRRHRVARSILANSIFMMTLFLVYTCTIAGSLFWLAREFFKHSLNEFLLDSLPILRMAAPFKLLGLVTVDPIKLVNTLINIAPALIALINQIISPIVRWVVKFERHHSVDGVRGRYITSVTFYTIFNSIVMPNAIFWLTYLLVFEIWAVPPFDNYMYFYNTTGMWSTSRMGLKRIILNKSPSLRPPPLPGINFLKFILAQLLLGKSLELIIIFFGLMIDLIRYKKMRRPKYDYVGNYAYRFLMVQIAVATPTIPLLVPAIFIYLVIMFLLDRWLIMYLFKVGAEMEFLFLCIFFPRARDRVC